VSGKKIRDRSSLGGDHMRSPSTASAGSTNHLNPTFCFKYARGLDGGERGCYWALVKTLRDIAQLTWQQIMFSQRKGMGFEKIPLAQLRVALDPYADSIDDVIAFRISEKWRLIGHRSDGILRVLYVDGAAEAYKH